MLLLPHADYADAADAAARHRLFFFNIYVS